jgi:bifunctional non-homologous end joining protein LigD
MPVLRFIEPCLPSLADKPPSGSNWIHEIKHDGFRLMARCDPVSIRLFSRVIKAGLNNVGWCS